MESIGNYKGREVPHGTSVFVYYNLHTHLWSVKALEGELKGLVIGHYATIGLDTVRPKVSERGRQRVIAEQRKNVHAGLVGRLRLATLERWRPVRQASYGRVSYNPYKGGTFYHSVDSALGVEGDIFLGSSAAILADKKVYI